MTTLALLVLGVLARVALAAAVRSVGARYRRLRSRVRRLTRTRVVLTTKAPARRGRTGRRTRR